MMATVEKAHVGSSAELLGEEPEPQDEHSSNHGDSDGGSEGGGADDGGTDEGASDDGGGEEEEADGDDGGSDGEEAEDEDGGGEDEEGEEVNPNAGWAEAMAKILGKKTPESKPSILLKNRERDKLKEKEKQEQLARKKQVDKKRAWEMMCIEKPDVVKDRETERNLQRTATRGVVQLFNAVRKHQKKVEEKVKEVGGSERKKAKLLSTISKRDFINVLRGTEGGSDAAVKERQAAAEEEEEKPAWSVLRDDFMMGASMKDWDKESDGEDGDKPETGQAAEDSDSD